MSKLSGLLPYSDYIDDKSWNVLTKISPYVMESIVRFLEVKEAD